MSSFLDQPRFQFQCRVYDAYHWPNELNDLVRLIKSILKDDCPSQLRLSYLDCDEDEIDILSQEDFEIFYQTPNQLLYVEEGGFIELPLTPPPPPEETSTENNQNDRQQNYFYQGMDQTYTQNFENMNYGYPQQTNIQDLVQKEVQRQMAELMSSINQSVYQQVRQDVDILFTEKTETLAQSIRQSQQVQLDSKEQKKTKKQKTQSIKDLFKKEIKALDEIQDKILESQSQNETEKAVQYFWRTWKSIKYGLRDHINNISKQIYVPNKQKEKKQSKKDKDLVHQEKQEQKKGKQQNSKNYKEEIKRKSQEMIQKGGVNVCEELLYEFVEVHNQLSVQELLDLYYENQQK